MFIVAGHHACGNLRQLNRLKLAEKERDSLEGAREEAQEYLRLDASIREKLNVLYQTMVAHAAANVEKVRRTWWKPKQAFSILVGVWPACLHSVQPCCFMTSGQVSQK